MDHCDGGHGTRWGTLQYPLRARDVSNLIRSLSAIKGNLFLVCALNALLSDSVPVLITNLKSGRQLRNPLNSLSISFQSPQRYRDGWVDPDGGLISSNTNSERPGDGTVERLCQKNTVGAPVKLENGAWSTMDRSDRFSRNLRRPKSRHSGDVN